MAASREALVVQLLAALITADAERVRQRPREAVVLASSLIDAVRLASAQEQDEKDGTVATADLSGGICVLGYKHHRWGGPADDLRCLRCGARDAHRARHAVNTTRTRARKLVRLYAAK